MKIEKIKIIRFDWTISAIVGMVVFCFISIVGTLFAGFFGLLDNFVLVPVAMWNLFLLSIGAGILGFFLTLIATIKKYEVEGKLR